MLITHEAGRLYDVLTGERIGPGDKILDTRIPSRSFRPVNLYPTLFMKETTLVRLMENAGYDVTKRDAGDSSDTKVVDGTDANAGGGAPTIGEDPIGGSTTTRKRPAGKTKG